MCDFFFDCVCFIGAIVERYLAMLSFPSRFDFASLALSAGHFMHHLAVIVVDGSKMVGGTVAVDATMRTDGAVLANGAAA